MAALLIANPWASGVDEDRILKVRSALPAGTELRLTSVRGEAMALARDIAGRVDALYVFGGDGTYNEVLNGIDDSTPVALIPGGGASVLPRALGVPHNPVAAARHVAKKATPRRITLGRVNGRRFGFAASIGLDAEVVRVVDELGRTEDGGRASNLKFAWAGMRTLSRHGFRLEPEVEVKGLGRAAAFVLVSNAPAYTYAGPVRIQPARATFEGGLDLVAPTQIRLRDVPGSLALALGGRDPARAPDLVYAHDADRLEVVCDRPLPLQADGEDLGDVTEALFEAERGALTVLV
jgi:diacylglycerol kinase family enzyme